MPIWLGAFVKSFMTDSRGSNFLRSRQHILASDRGFLLLEGLLATAIITLVGYFALSLNNYFNKSLSSESSKVVQNFENIEFIKRITEPVYFGSLARYDQNLQLRKCLSIDENFCDTSQVYPFQALDLATDKAMSFASNDFLGRVRTETFFKVHCADAQTSCDKAEYFTVIVKTYVYNEQDQQISFVEKSDIVAPQFNNVYTYVPSSELSPGRPINVIIYLDNSGSMLGVKDKVKTALSEILDKLSNLDVRIGLYTLYTSTRSSPRVVLEEYYLDSLNQKQPLPDPLPNPFDWYRLIGLKAGYLGLYQDSMNYFDQFNQVYDFKVKDSYDLRAQKLGYLKQLADYYYDNSWAGAIDTPLCSILRMLEAPSSSPRFSYDSFTPNIVYIITNEDDETNVAASDSTYTGGCPHSELEHVTRTTTSGGYMYDAVFQYLTLDVNANFSFDGALVNQNFQFKLSIDKYQNGVVNAADCKAYAESIYDYIEHGLQVNAPSKSLVYTKGSGYVINSCQYLIQRLGNIGYSQTQLTDYCSNMDNGIKPTPFLAYDPDLFPAYVPNSCTETYYAPQVSTSWKTDAFYPLGTVAGVSNSDTATLVYEALKRNTDLNNFYYVPIIHPDSTTCGGLTDGAQVGTKYLQLANKPGINSTVIPVCSSDFSGPLNSIISWTNTMGINDLEISSYVAANFGSVELIRNGATIQLTMGVDFDLSGTTILFKPGVVSANDTIKVYTK